MKGLALLALSTVATGYGTLFSHDMPPPRYQGNAIVKVHFASHDEVTRVCAVGMPPPPPGKEYSACTKSNGQIWMINPCGFADQDYALTMCHEAAHKQGWPRDHPAF